MEVVHDDRSLPGHQCLKVFFFLLQRNKLLQEFERVPSESFLRMLVFKLIKHQVAKVITWGGGNGTTGVKEFHHGGSWKIWWRVQGRNKLKPTLHSRLGWGCQQQWLESRRLWVQVPPMWFFGLWAATRWVCLYRVSTYIGEGQSLIHVLIYITLTWRNSWCNIPSAFCRTRAPMTIKGVFISQAKMRLHKIWSEIVRQN